MTKPSRVLIVTTNPVLPESAQALRAAGWDVLATADPTQVRQALASGAADAVLIELGDHTAIRLPPGWPSSGLETPRTGDTPSPLPRARHASQPVSGHVLLVDRNPDSRRHIAELAGRQLIEVHGAATADEALAALAKGPVDAALVDMPEGPGGIDAFGLVRRIRAAPQGRSLPVAFLSEDDRLENRVGAAHAGASLFLTKPLDPEAFAEALQRLLARHAEPGPRILLVGGAQHARGSLSSVFTSAGMTVEAVSSAAEGLVEVERLAPDLVVVDLSTNARTGLDLCRALRTSSRWQDLPVICLTGRDDPQERLRAFEAGADDIAPLSAATGELTARVRLRVDRARLSRERAERDTLSGLPLRRAALELLRARLAEAARHDRVLSVALIDLDQFKSVNDLHGHEAGDQVIAALGQLLQSRFRVEDVRARWGGEEFLVAFPGEPPATAARILRRLLDEVAETEFAGDHGTPFRITFTAGLAGYPDDARSLEELLRQADRRLYLGKAAGRARVVDEG